jgi:demethylmenaquinone methyltransferase/2-methoxy-6-polyprenyl-1,4-benzoquinol methylase
VLKPGGKVMVLEFGQPQTFGFKQAYHLYSKSLLPLVGGIISGDTSAYKYLEKSSSQFASGQDFLQMAQSTQAFSKLESTCLMGGLAWIYSLSTPSQH